MFWRIAKALAFMALATPISWVEEQMKAMKSLVSASFMERPRFSYQVLLTGLEFLRVVCTDLGLGMDGNIDMLRDALLASVAEKVTAIAQSKSRSEVDAVLETLGVMASLTRDGSDQWIIQGKHYIAKDDSLLIDLPIAHAL